MRNNFFDQTYNKIDRLESTFSHAKRRKLRKAFLILTLLATVASVYPDYRNQSTGLIFIFGSIYGFFSLVEAFFYSVFNKIKEEKKSFATLSSISGNQYKGIIFHVSKSFFGSLLLYRLGIINDVASDMTAIVTEETLMGNESTLSEHVDITATTNLGALMFSLSKVSPTFKNILEKHATTLQQLTHAASWLERLYIKEIEREKWWSEQNLFKTQPFASDWAYGQTDTLEKYGSFIPSEYSGAESYQGEINKIELVLSKPTSPYALVIGESETGTLTLIQGLAGRISETHDKHAALHGKRIFMLNTSHLFQIVKNGQDFEATFSGVLFEAERVGNVVFAIDNFSLFIESAQSLGVDGIMLLVSCLRVSSMPLIVLADTHLYFQKIQKHTELSQYFEVVQTSIKDKESLLFYIQDHVLQVEGMYEVTFLYQTLEVIAESAERYFEGEALREKALDLLIEVAEVVKAEKGRVVTTENVLSLIKQKTGIPTGQINEEEKEKLLNLESLLHQKVIGQNEAIVSIANALRRSRSGIGKHNKPIGSFLFLGPTGVGKTETTKALSDIFFGEKAPMVRFDMSEYSGADGLARLIGQNNSSGLLADAIRERHYGVLLLDEFEKASKEVHNLFLQILDEGFFSDSTGKHVNLRNMIIVATSNAGSAFIISQTGEDLQKNKPDIINQIISQGIFRPELLNRFDGVILFESLNQEQVGKVIQLMLKDLSHRLEEKGVEILVTDELVQYLMSHGTDARFGARPLNRLIADVIEEKIAEGLISGNIMSGAKVSFVQNEQGALDIKQM